MRYDTGMKVILHHPKREIELPGGRKVLDLLRELELIPESVLVIREDELLMEEEWLGDQDRIEIRPVISGGEQRP